MENFYYFICNVGNEKLLKEQIKIQYPQMNFAYSQKGFLTYKGYNEIGDDLAFCRSMGKFLRRGGKELIDEFNLEKGAKAFFSLEGEVFFNNTDEFKDERNILELIQLSEDKFYLGHSLINRAKKYFPLGDPKVPWDENSPSRAYMKILEALKIFNVEILESDVVVEFGASPGGATYAMLKTGATVVGIDPGIMDPKVFSFKKFQHLNMSIQDVIVTDLPEQMDWILVDMNLSPEAGISELEKLIIEEVPTIKGVFFTSKLTKMNVLERIEFYKKLFIKMGFERVYTQQVPHHKQEFLIFATH